MYVASGGADFSGSNAVAAFSRAGDTGALTSVGCVSDTGGDGRPGTDGFCANGDALLGASGLAVSPDGRNVYVSSHSSNGVAWLDAGRGERQAQPGRLHQELPARRPLPRGLRARGDLRRRGEPGRQERLRHRRHARLGQRVLARRRHRQPRAGDVRERERLGRAVRGRHRAARRVERGRGARRPPGVRHRGGDRRRHRLRARRRHRRADAPGLPARQGAQGRLVHERAPARRRRGQRDHPRRQDADRGEQPRTRRSRCSRATPTPARSRLAGCVKHQDPQGDDAVDEEEEDFEDEEDAEEAQADCTPAKALYFPREVVVSADGRGVFAVGGDSLAAFRRDPASGELTQTGCAEADLTYKSCSETRNAFEPRGIAASSDARSLYVTSDSENAVSAFAAVGGDPEPRRAGRPPRALPRQPRLPGRARARLRRAAAGRLPGQRLPPPRRAERGGGDAPRHAPAPHAPQARAACA